MLYVYYTLALCVLWFVVGIIKLAPQWNLVERRLQSLYWVWETFEAMPVPDRTEQAVADHVEVCDELRSIVVILCIYCGPILAVPAFVAWIYGQLTE